MVANPTLMNRRSGHRDRTRMRRLGGILGGDHMTSNDKKQRNSSIERWLKQLRHTSGRRGVGDPRVVHAIESRLMTELDPSVRRQLNLELASEHKALGRYDHSESIY